MKIIKLLIPAFLAFSLAGCFDIDEEIDINKNGSGEWKMDVDLSQMIDLMQTYMGKDDFEKQMPQKKMDTNFYIRDLVDTMKNMPQEKKALLQEGQVHLKLDLDEKVFKTSTVFPFKNVSDLQNLRNLAGSNSFGAGQLLKGLGGESSGGAQSPDMGLFGSIYEFRIKDGRISSTINKANWDSLQKSSQFDQLKAAGSSGIDVPYSLTIKLPRPAKKIDNPMLKLSDDKLTVTCKYNMMETFEQPDKFVFTIEY